MSSIAIYGAGQLGSRVAAILRERGVHRVSGPFTRDQVADALDSGVDLVIIATTSRLRDVADDVKLMLLHERAASQSWGQG